MATITIVEPTCLDFDMFVKLQRAAYAKIICQTGTSYLFSEAYYRWKYFTPAGLAKIALMKDVDGLISANSMYPVTITSGSDRMLGWQSCDTATHPRGRGKGYFTKCLDALKAELKGEGLFFGFPNRNSMPGFVKFGWTEHDNLRAWARVLPGRNITNFSKVDEINEFGIEQDAFSVELSGVGGAMFDRSSNYMNWRYKKHPLHQYEAFGWREAGHLLGILVLRRGKIAGRELVIVMEALSLTPYVERGLLAFAASRASEEGVAYTLALNNTTRLVNGLLSAYMPIPKWALPRRPVFMGSPVGFRAQAFWSKAWHVQIGDWDGF